MCRQYSMRIAPSQKNPAQPNRKYPKERETRTRGVCTFAQMVYRVFIKSGHHFFMLDGSHWYSHRRCAHQKPPCRGLDTSSTVSEFAWWLRWFAIHVLGEPEALKQAEKIRICSITGLSFTARWARAR